MVLIVGIVALIGSCAKKDDDTAATADNATATADNATTTAVTPCGGFDCSFVVQWYTFRQYYWDRQPDSYRGI